MFEQPPKGDEQPGDESKKNLESPLIELKNDLKTPIIKKTDKLVFPKKISGSWGLENATPFNGTFPESLLPPEQRITELQEKKEQTGGLSPKEQAELDRLIAEKE